MSLLSRQTQNKWNAPDSLLPLYLLVPVAALLLLINLGVYPAVWFDEGYKANGAHTLVQDGVYGTHTASGYIPFDPGLSSGPIDLGLMAMTFAAFGEGVMQMRLSSVAMTLLALIALYAVAVRLYGPKAGFIVILFFLAFPAIGDTGFLLIGRQALSEPSALALIACGLLVWFAGWDNARWYMGLAAGLLMGLGLLSKTQYAIALVPAIFLVSAAFSLRQRTHMRYFGVTLLALALVIGVWMGLSRSLTPPRIAQENSAMLMDAIETNLITGLWGQTLTGKALLIIGIMSAAVISTAWRLWQQPRQSYQSQHWAEITLAAFVSITIIWYALFSVGWPRYAYAGLVFSLLLLGKGAYDLLSYWQPRLLASPAPLIASLILIVIAVNLIPQEAYNRPGTNANAIADHIDGHIPDTAIIETWEWELTVLSDHENFHLPHQSYLFEAIRQFSHERRPQISLSYDVLQADPDYLILGPFAQFTNIYPPVMIDTYFRHVATFGNYQLYERIQEIPDA